MNVLDIEHVDIHPVVVVTGLVTTDRLVIGDDLEVRRNQEKIADAIVMGILPAQEGLKHFDDAPRGARVRVVLRLNPRVPLDAETQLTRPRTA